MSGALAIHSLTGPDGRHVRRRRPDVLDRLERFWRIALVALAAK